MRWPEVVLRPMKRKQATRLANDDEYCVKPKQTPNMAKKPHHKRGRCDTLCYNMNWLMLTKVYQNKQIDWSTELIG